MKHVWNFIKTLLIGLYWSIPGALCWQTAWFVKRNINIISSGSGWNVVLAFVFCVVEIILSLCLLYTLGEAGLYYHRGRKNKEETKDDTNNDIGEESDSQDAKHK
jgi:hypothetical protein